MRRASADLEDLGADLHGGKIAVLGHLGALVIALGLGFLDLGPPGIARLGIAVGQAR